MKVMKKDYKRKWSKFNFSRRYPLTPSRQEEATKYFERADGDAISYADTLHFEKEVREDELDLVDNDINNGWPYND
jgi:hypothetical protein